MLHKMPYVRLYMPPEMAADDFRLMIYHGITIYKKAPSMSEFEYNVIIYNIIYKQHVLHHTNTL